jgi:hypothetical protein
MSTCSVKDCLATLGLTRYGDTSSYYCPYHYQACLRLEAERPGLPFLCMNCLAQHSQGDLGTVFLEMGAAPCSACHQQDILFFYHLPSVQSDRALGQSVPDIRK